MMSVGVTTAREIARHVLFKSGLYGVLTAFRRMRHGRKLGHIVDPSLKSRFTEIYKTGVWKEGEDAGAPDSGAGSTLAATDVLRHALPGLLQDLDARVLLDIGCGDFTWMQHVSFPQKYIGIDVVDTVIDANNKQFKTKIREFAVCDATKDDLPEADTVLCRQVLFHLCFSDIKKLLENVLSKDRAYLIADSDRSSLFNSDIPSGDFRLFNLEANPFRFPTPDFVIDDSKIRANRVIGVWDCKKIRRILKNKELLSAWPKKS